MHLNPACMPPHRTLCVCWGFLVTDSRGFGRKKKGRITVHGTGDMNWLQEITRLLRQQSASGQASSAVGGVGMEHIQASMSHFWCFLKSLSLVLWPRVWPTLEMLPAQLKRSVFCCFWTGCAVKNQVSPPHLTRRLMPVSPYWLSGRSVHWCEWGAGVPHSYCVTADAPLTAVSTSLAYWGAPAWGVHTFTMLCRLLDWSLDHT